MPLLEALGLVKQYGRRKVVDGVDLRVEAGEIVGLLGPNGAGKTTCFRMLAGMVTPTAGNVTFAGQDVTASPMYIRARLGLGYLAQEQSIFRKLTVEQNLSAILELMTTRRGKPFRSNGRQRRQRVDQLLEQFGLGKVRRNLAMTCSGGEKRRLEIARCLISEPMLIMLDEPFTGIDPITVNDIQQIVRGLRDEGIGVLITDHQVAETLRITDRSYLVAAGKLLVHGTPLEIINDPDARRVYLGENFQAGGIGDSAASPGASPAHAAHADTVAYRSPPANPFRSLLDSEEIHEWIDRLGGPEADAAGEKILARGTRAVQPLVQALGRSDLAIRRQVHLLLCELMQVQFPFDPNGHENTRTQQIACIREYLDERLAS